MPTESDVSWASATVGLLLATVGVLAMLALLMGTSSLGVLVAPTLFALGLVVFARGVWPGGPLWGRSPVLCMGLVLLLIGGFPWLYTPYLTGDRPGGESAGMLGTILFLFAGLPGLLLTCVGGLIWILQHATGRASPH